VTYEFFENQWFHPHVGAGLGVVRESAWRSEAGVQTRLDCRHWSGCMKSVMVLFVVGMLCVQPAAAQITETADLWRAFAEKLEVGSTVKVRLQNGRQFTATLVQARPDVVLLQPKTRVAVPVRLVAYDAILSMDPIRTGGIGAGKAAAIGIAAGVGAFLATLLIFAALAME